ncbi:hypothetical protein JHK87_047934 [Glycine soja]|nr:hypothetical protein JHK87_047934 [Glycine soja]
MQSIHDLAQHRPIISMEDFMAQVAWPGVQPSPAGGGEASTAQEPQPKPEATPDATPEDMPAATPMAVTEEGDSAADTDYVVDMIAAQNTWDPWHTLAQDTTSTPAQDAPSTPHDDPTTAQDY